MKSGAPSRAFGDRFGPARIYAWVGGVCLLLLVFLVPPFQVPDEPQHFFRSYQLSLGEVWSRQEGGIVGSDLPASLPALVERFMGTNALHTERVIRTQPLATTLAELKRPLDAERTAFVAFGTGSYAPLQYVPQALAIVIGRAMDVGPLGLFYMARLANALVAWVLTCVALGAFHVGGRFALLVALLPMTQFMTASCSPDAMTIAGAMVFTSIIARFATDGTWSRGRWFAAFVSGTAMCSIKVVFLPMLVSGLAALFVPGRLADHQVRRAILSQLAMAFLVIVITAWWMWSLRGIGGSPANEKLTQYHEGVNMAKQLAYLAQEPLTFFRILARSFYYNGDFLWTSTVGLLGWLNLWLPGWTYWAIGLGFALGIYSETRTAQIPIAGIAWLLLLAASSVFLTELALYLMWTPVAADKVEGVQGRYFIPVLPLVGFCLASVFVRRPSLSRSDHAYLLLVAMIIVVTATTIITIVRRYGLYWRFT